MDRRKKKKTGKSSPVARSTVREGCRQGQVLEEVVVAVRLSRRKLFYDYSFIFINVKAASFLPNSCELGAARNSLSFARLVLCPE